MPTLNIAVNGCSHGEFHTIFDTLKHIEEKENIHTDALLCCGDFQAVRPEPFPDLDSLAVPPKHLKLGDFHEYYQQSPGRSPPLTIFIGGNHESSHHLAELAYGGWASPFIYFLGRCGAIRLGYSEHNSVLIGGISGIFKPYDFDKGLFEKYPLAQNEKKSVYHIRFWDQWRMLLLKSLNDKHPDSSHTTWNIGMSHEWPQNVTEFCSQDLLEQELYKRQRKQFFRDEINNKELGCPVARKLFDAFQPDYWFSGHLHCDLAFECQHEKPSQRSTKFLALDKVMPKRKFLQIVQIDLPEEPKEGEKLSLFYDRNWLAVIKATHELTPTTEKAFEAPADFGEALEKGLEFVNSKYGQCRSKEQQESASMQVGDFVRHTYSSDDPLFNPYTTQLYRDLNLSARILNRQVRRSLPPQFQRQRGGRGRGRQSRSPSVGFEGNQRGGRGRWRGGRGRGRGRGRQSRSPSVGFEGNPSNARRGGRGRVQGRGGSFARGAAGTNPQSIEL